MTGRSRDWHDETADAALARLQTSAQQGLASIAVAERQTRHGPNELPRPTLPGLLQIAVRQLADPVVWMLLVAAVVSLLVGHLEDSGFIALVVVIDVVIATLQERSAQRSAEALQQLTRFTCIVVRDGHEHEVPARELVPGDIVVIQEGLRIPADVRLLTAEHLQVDESMLTGESDAEAKEAIASLPRSTPLADRTNMLHAGTFVQRGRGRGVVVATGLDTEVGRIAAFVQQPRSAATPLMRRMREVARRMSWVAFVLIAVVVLLGLARGEETATITLAAVALGVSAIPEGLPVALTIALALSMRRMSRRNVIARRMSSVEALGACTAIATDKTGTLTMNELSVRSVALPPAGDEAGLQTLAHAAVRCNDASVSAHPDGRRYAGDSVDVALVRWAETLDVDILDSRRAGTLTWLQPFDAHERYAAALHERRGARTLVVKGAPERVLAMCSTIRTAAGTRPLDPDAVEAIVHERGARGDRLIAVADRPVDEDVPAMPPHGLRLLGLVGLSDPLRPEAAASVRACHRAGVRVAMVTGDHPLTACTIARELGWGDAPTVATGVEVAAASRQSSGALDELVSRTDVFARVDPIQKVDIVESLQRLGNVVAVTGDGVNDAPALTRADVGVAMGERGTDVARDAADIVLADDDFSSIVAGIEEGRIAYRNVRKVVYLLASTALAEILLFLLALAVGSPVPLLAAQLLWLNLVTNGIQDVGLALEPGEGDELEHPPRRPDAPVFDRIMLERLLVSATWMAGCAFVLFEALLATGMEVPAARNLVLLLMVLFENVQVGLSRSETRGVLTMSPLHNPWLVAGTVASQLVHVVALYVPVLQDVLDTRPVAFTSWLLLLLVAATLAVVVELHKLLRGRALAERAYVHGQPNA